MKKLDFWFDPASTYSYIAAMRADDAAAAAGVELNWRPFLLGPIFKAQGMESSPFNLFPVKGRYMWRDLQRLAADLCIPLHTPSEADFVGFPRNSLLAARACLAALRHDWGRDFVRGLYKAEFGDWLDIADPKVVAAVAASLGQDGEALLAATQDDAVKGELRANTEEAQASGIFGAPSFVCDGELFWGSDRLDNALAFAAARASAQ